jgi:hypothetical protein
MFFTDKYGILYFLDSNIPIASLLDSGVPSKTMYNGLAFFGLQLIAINPSNKIINTIIISTQKNRNFIKSLVISLSGVAIIYGSS